MKSKKKYIKNLILGLFLLLVLVVGLTSFFDTNTFSAFTEIENVWSGNIASSFDGGNGTIDNPYQISNGEELALFSEMIKSNKTSLYKNKYYIITNDINMGNLPLDPIGNDSNYFSGYLNGQGHHITNLNINKIIGDDNIYYSGLFSKLDGATIENINLSNVTINNRINEKENENNQNAEDDNEDIIKEDGYYSGIISGLIQNKTLLNNISIVNSNITLEGKINTDTPYIGGISGYTNQSTIKNIYANINITSEKNAGSITSYASNDSTFDNILIESNEEKYSISDYNFNKIYTKETASEEYYKNLAKSLDNVKYEWTIEDNVYFIKRLEKEQLGILTLFSVPIGLHDSGIEGNTVYVNDLEADWNEFMGFNFTESKNGTLPTGVNQKIYNESNLVKMQINYIGSQTIANGKTLTAYVSNKEEQNKYTYYHVYKVNDNGTSNPADDYVMIELIDNPFASLPTGYAFNNWVASNPNVEVSYNPIYYSRYAKVPVTYTDGIPDEIVVDFEISFVEGTIEKVSLTNSLDDTISKLKNSGMEKIVNIKKIYEPYDMTGYYYQRTADNKTTYSGYTQNGGTVNAKCNNKAGCIYYERINNEQYSEEKTYYQLQNNKMQVVDPSSLPLLYEVMPNPVYDGMIMAGYFKMITLNKNQSQAGYYTNTGDSTTGICTVGTGCIVYEMIKKYDNYGNTNLFDVNNEYYYLVTRDTNIVVIDTDVTGVWASHTKPLTVTSLYAGSDYRSSVNWNISSNLSCYSDTRIEFVTIKSDAYDSNTTPGSTTRAINASWKNLKIGRGILKSGTYRNVGTINGNDASVTSSGSATDTTKYRLIIESGFYNTTSLINRSGGSEVYAEMKAVYGNDYDRVTNNNQNLDIYYCASGSWSGNIRSASATTTAISLTVKSGSFGTGKYDYSTGIYIGGRAGGVHYATRAVTVEGGYIYNLIGGPLTADTRTNINDIIMSIKGGTIDMITGGAGQTTTYGNRIIQITGGTINYSVFGGSNGYTGSASDGTLNGTPFIYVGGNAVIGSQDNVRNNRTLYGAEAGSVFGIGNGRNGNSYTKIGTCANSNIIIDGDARVLRNVYLGGNYAAVGVADVTKTPQSKLQILNGTIEGNTFGGGNKNGSGTSEMTSSVKVDIYGGTVKGSVYGGANEKGIVYGAVYINANAGTIENDIYGGGYGGYSSTSSGTYIRDKINIAIGNSSHAEKPTINGSVYGGSAYGSVNGTANNSTGVSTNGVEINVNKGIIKNAVFGGGKGNATYTPKVYGDILVNINGGNIGEVYGGNDASGKPNGQINIYLKDGVVGNVYGGGNNASVNTNHIYLQGGEITTIFGGSNSSGVVTESNVIATGGKVSYIYGGGRLATTTTSNITLLATEIPNVFGGGENADVTNKTNIELNGAKVTNLYGGSDSGGNIPISDIKLINGEVTNVFGGNNENGLTSKSKISVNGATIENLYGGGNNVGIDSSDITLLKGKVTNVYGGSNKKGTVIDTSIKASGSSNTGEFAMSVATEQSEDDEFYLSTSKISVTISNNSSSTITQWNGYIKTTETELFENRSNTGLSVNDNTYSFDQTNKYGNDNRINSNNTYSFEFITGNNTSYKEFKIIEYYIVGYDSTGKKYEFSSSVPQEITVQNVYGGNNLGGTTNNTTISLENGTYDKVFGGGNQAIVSNNTLLKINGATITSSVYGGGNQAAVEGNTEVNIAGATTVGKSVFGGGNHGAIGPERGTSSQAVVNIAGATIGENVYGGCNTSEVNGTTEVNIGKTAVEKSHFSPSSINIKGTVFGGGESNEAGSDKYDFEHISVTKGINIDINGTDYENNNYDFTISGSIFGSGNASSSAGPSNVYIGKLGTRKHPNTATSIQRADQVIIDNSSIEFIGTTDSTNDYSHIKYSINRIKKLKLKNSSDLLLRQNANMLEEFESLVDIDGKEVKAAVSINDDTKKITKNVDNRLYLLAGNNLNVTTNQAATAYGIVSGMTFLGMYQTYSNGSYVYGMYDSSMSYGDSATAGDVIVGGSYVLGLHALDHDITIDGYYTNYIDDDYTVLTTAYVEPTPPSSNYYMWTIGTASINYSFAITASKYSSLGTYELSMKDFSDGNVTFNVLGFNGDGLTEGVILQDPNSIPKLASSQEEANNVIGLAMKSETVEWTNHGTTKFYKDETSSFAGDNVYVTDNQELAPSLMFYLYHAKNISSDEELGTAVITLQALRATSEIDYEVKLITISVTIDTKDYNDGDSYDASITYSKKYEMPSATDVNITKKSQFTTYYSLLASTDEEKDTADKKDVKDYYGKNFGNYHVLVSNYALPVGTKITMIDYGYNDSNPNYYYYIIDESAYNKAVDQLSSDKEIIYRLSDFIKMGSTDKPNNYKDSESNKVYYHEDINFILEEFVFIFDFEDTDIPEAKMNNTIMFELRNSEDRTLINVLGIRQNLMFYNLYDESNELLSEDYSIDNNHVYYEIPKNIEYNARIGYDQTDLRQSIIDTNYESSSMGINIVLFDKAGNQVSASQLSSSTISIDNSTYYVDSSGVFRIKLADKVSNLNKNLLFTTGSNLPVGTYTMRISLFASSDGLHNSSDKEPTVSEFEIIVVGDNNLLIVDTETTNQLIIGETGLNMANTNVETFNLRYNSVLENPNIRIVAYRRSTESSLTTDYVEYNVRDLFTNTFSYPLNPLESSSKYEYVVSITPKEQMTLNYKLRDTIKSGTYKIIFRLYDGNQMIEEDYKYIIIRKNI